VIREFPLRPGYGTLGTEVVLRTNFLPMELRQSVIYDYDVKITPTKFGKSKKLRIFELLEQHPSFSPYLGHIAHDKSARMVSAQELPQPLDIKVSFHADGSSEPGDVYTVSITLTQKLDTSELNKGVSSCSS
jgi:hypothetical protein